MTDRAFGTHLRKLTCCAIASASMLLTVSAAEDGAMEQQAEQGRTPAEWLAEIEAGRKKPVEDTEFELLLHGASMAIGPYTGKLSQDHKRSEEQLRWRAGFEHFMKERGNAMLEKWRSGEVLTDGEAKYRWIFNGVCFSEYHKDLRRRRGAAAKFTEREQACMKRNRAVEKRGRALLAKGYTGGKFTSKEIDDMRLYAMWVDIRCCGTGVLPFHLSLTRATRLRNGRFGFKLGQKAPDFTCMRMEAALNSPDYSDENPYDPTDVLKPAVLREHLLNLQGYEPTGAEAGPKVKARPIVVPEGREADYVRLSNVNKDKPVLLVLANPTDSWCWHWKIAPMFEPLYQAYKDDCDFFIVNTTIHDTYMPMKDFLGPNAGHHSAVHDLTLEQRARTSKMFYMNWPQHTVPYLLDDMSQRLRDAYMDQGGGAYILLIDRDGAIAYVDYHQDIPKGLSFYDEVIYVRMNNLESRLNALAANDWRYAKSVATPLPTWRRSPLHARAKIESIDVEAELLEVTAKVDGKPVRQKLAVTPRSRVLVNYDPATLTDLKQGETVEIRYTATEADGVAGRIEYLRARSDWGRRVSTIWLSGRITEVAQDALKVGLTLPPAEEMKGLGFWNAAGDVVPYDETTKGRLDVVRRWVADADKPRIYNFAIDDATTIFLDGHAAKLDQLKPGDHVGVEYRSFHDKLPQILPDQVRAYRPPK
jgi:hypothetical protein